MLTEGGKGGFSESGRLDYTSDIRSEHRQLTAARNRADQTNVTDTSCTTASADSFGPLALRL